MTNTFTELHRTAFNKNNTDILNIGCGLSGKEQKNHVISC